MKRAWRIVLYVTAIFIVSSAVAGLRNPVKSATHSGINRPPYRSEATLLTWLV